MKAAVFEGDGCLVVKEISDPVLKGTRFIKGNGGSMVVRKEDLVLLKILKAGICGTDIRILSIPPSFKAKIGTIIGHEFVGEVVDAGSRVKRVSVGDIVVVDEHINCGDCWYCRRGLLNRCEEMASMGMSTHGGFAEYAVVPSKQVYKIPADMDLRRAVLFEPLYCAVHAINKVGITPDSKVLIYGAGPLGCCFIELCRIYGANAIIVSEPESFRSEYALRLGATTVINPITDDLGKIIKKIAPYGVDIAIDAWGDPRAIKEAIGLTRPYGKILLFGEQDNKSTITLSFAAANRKELELYGSSAASPFVADKTIGYMNRSDFCLDKMITHEFSLDEILTGIELMRQKKAIKIIIDPWR